MKKLVSVTSRTGRQFQRYTEGCRQVVGCIPYRYKNTNNSGSVRGIRIDDVEVLLISSQKSSRLMFPKGGWELDESIKEAASRETLEEAGVLGTVGDELGIWNFKSRSQDKFHEGRMLPLLVSQELDEWPEKNRRRIWMTINQASAACSHAWMREALDEFVNKCLLLPRKQEENRTSCLLEYLITEEHSVAQKGEEEVDRWVVS